MRSAFAAQAGLRVVVHGRVDLYEPTGAMQLYVDSIQPAGLGDLALRFEALKARLAAEGLFDTARKRPLPSRPRTIAVVTSPSGAVWRDISHVLARRWPLVQVVLVAAQVQGDGAPASIVTALRRTARYAQAMHDAGRPDDAPALTILARGGGSLEDLWAFNDERVVRAVVAHPLPVVCGVGHEVDVTLADFAADVRAPTPSAAAEIVVPDRLEMAGALRRAADRLATATERRLAAAARDLAVERRALDRREPGRPACGGPRAGRPPVRPRDARRRGTAGPGAPQARDRVIRVAALRCRPGRGRAVGPRRLGGRAGRPRSECHARARVRDRPTQPGRCHRPRPGRRARWIRPAHPRGARRDRRDRRRGARSMSQDLVVFVIAVAVLAIVGVAIGMLVAPRLGRLAERIDEDAGDGTD